MVAHHQGLQGLRDVVELQKSAGTSLSCGRESDISGMFELPCGTVQIMCIQCVWSETKDYLFFIHEALKLSLFWIIQQN